MCRLADLRRRLEAKREEFRRYDALVNGALLCEDILRDLEAVERADAVETLDRRQAADLMEVHPDSITRAIRCGRLENVGTRRRPRVRKVDVVAVVGTRRNRHCGSGAERGADAIARQAIASRLR
jgi:hypothetical protein